MTKNSWHPDALAKAYFEKFLMRVEILREFYKRKGYSDVIREGQEALELGLKGVLRSLSVEPTHSHDPGKELAPVVDRLPAALKKIAPELVSWSSKLRRERELSYYGAADFIPTQEYKEDEALVVIEFLERVAREIKAL